MKTKNYKILADCRDMYEQEIIDTILENRGIQDPERFLNPVEDDMLPLDSLYRIDEARQIIEDGLRDDKNFAILWDTDTDGVSSGALITRYLKHFTNRITTHIDFGKSHGLIGQDLSQFEYAEIIIIVDSLDKDTSQYEILHSQGKQIIVLDHHLIDLNVDYDKYITLVSSQREYGNPHLSGAGVVWKFCKYLDECWLEEFADDYMDLAACGILADVCDVSESSKENRYIISKGLDNLKNPAVKKIVGSYEFNSKAILFSVAPLINAACRIGRNEVAMNLFLADENKEVLKLKKQLEECKEIQAQELERILPVVTSDFDAQSESNILYSFIDTQYGVGGVVGNKCVEKYNKPLFILKDIGDRYAGSMRSIGYGNFMKLCNDTGLAVLNGHEQASGIEIKKEHFDKFIKEINSILEQMKQTTSEEVQVDCEISLTDMTRNLIDKVKQVNRISGAGFKPITFKIADINEYEIGNFKQGKHLVIKPKDYIQLIEWNTAVDFDEMEDAAMMNEPIEVYGEMDSGFQGRQFMLKLIISDLKVGA